MQDDVLTKLEEIKAMLGELLGKDTPGQKEILNIQDVEKEFGISHYRQREARRDPHNTLEYILVGSGIGYRREQINAWLDKQSVTSE